MPSTLTPAANHLCAQVQAVCLAVFLLTCGTVQAQASLHVVGPEAQMSALRSGHCTALAPQGWTMTTNPQSSTAELRSADGRLYAGWGVVAINPAMQAYYGNLYGPPATSLAFLANTLVQQIFGDASGVRYTGAAVAMDGAVSRREFASERHQGVMYYRIYPMAGGYVESAYFAIASTSQWPAAHALLAHIAASIRCTTALRPQERGPDTGGKRAKRDGADGLSKSTYNKELGTEYAHSPTTGQNYLVSPATDYINGPQGYGAYIRNGNDYIKLERGRSD